MKTILGLIKTWFKLPLLHSSLFWGFVKQEIQGRYAGSFGGALWSIVTPLSNMIIYIFIFSAIMKIRINTIDTGTDSFVIYLLSGLLPWLAFSESINSSTGVFIGKANFITKVVFPVELLPIVSVVVPFLLHGVGFLIFLLYLVFNGYLHMAWLFLPCVIAFHMMFTLGLVILISSLCVFIRDIQQFIGVIMSLWVYLTPIMYPVSMVPDEYLWILNLNPMYPFIELYHMVLLKHSISWELSVWAAVLAFFSFLSGIVFFKRARYAFADVL